MSQITETGNTIPADDTDAPADADSTGAGSLVAESVSDRLDRLSLEQALIDVEVANARVIDLTARLTEAHAETGHLRQHVHELSQAAAAHAQAAAASTIPVQGMRSTVTGPVKAVARRVLPIGVRSRIRQLIG